jgi:hypothetical protein
LEEKMWKNGTVKESMLIDWDEYNKKGRAK